MKESSKNFLASSLPHLRELIFADLDEYFEDVSDLAYEEHNAIVDLYTMYSSYEIDSYNHIVGATSEFFDFLINSEPYKNDSFVRDSINRAKRIVNRYINRFRFLNEGSSFAQTALELSPSNPEDSHFLDIGPGFTPYSSLYIANSAKKVSAMDKDFLFSTKSLSNMNVDAQKKYFDAQTSVDNYDFVVGCRPCSAIPYIVSQCKTANKPYFLKLCDCAIYDKNTPLLDYFASKGMFKWNEILPELDPSIKLYNDYAFNIDATPEQINRITSNKILKQPPRITLKRNSSKSASNSDKTDTNKIDSELLQNILSK